MSSDSAASSHVHDHFVEGDGWMNISIVEDYGPFGAPPSGIVIVSPNILEISVEPAEQNGDRGADGLLSYLVRIEEIVPDNLAREE
jgi:hypothetical protein